VQEVSGPALLNIKALSALWGVFNSVVFLGKLDKLPRIELHKDKQIRTFFEYLGEKRIHGYFTVLDEPVIVLNVDTLETDEEVVSTLVHEMIHQWQNQIDHKDKDHGCEYQRLRRKIKRRHNINV
jgi:hypothetical protein